MPIVLLSLLLLHGLFASAQNGLSTWTTTPLNAPSFPLAVKTPYMNVWEPHANSALSFSNTWAVVGPSYTPIGWVTIITVDKTPYQLMGEATPGIIIATQVAVIMTPTRTSILFEAGPVLVNATYLSPVVPSDLVQQSFPFSYYYLSISSDSPHEIRVYSDITAEWMGGDHDLQSNWSATDDDSVIYLQSQLTVPSPFEELLDRPMDGIAYHAMLHRTGISWQIEDLFILRASFANGTDPNNTADSSSHPLDNPFDALGIALDLGTFQSTSEPLVWAVGVVRDPVIKFTKSTGELEERRAFYWSNITSMHDAIQDFLVNFDNALESAVALDNQILVDGSEVSSNYYDLLALSTRQAMGAVDFTIGQDSSGNWNTSDVMAFMRGTAGMGSGGVNGVDVLYAASPIYLYLNPSILGYLLRPLLEYQESSLYPNAYAAIDIGTNYSMAIGNNKEHDEGIEQSGNMLIMAYAHAQRTADTSLLTQHYDLLRGWADYLVNNSLAPGNQRTSVTDGISSVNQTNLALKGIIGIGAMSGISRAVDKSTDSDYYQMIASSYVQQWLSLALSLDGSHITSQFEQDSSFSLLYNLYAHKLLQLELLPDSVFSSQTAFYKSQLEPSQYGLLLDSSNASMTRSDWMMFTAASASDNTLRDALVSQIHAYASVVTNVHPFEVVYNPITGEQIIGSSSPAQGAMFAILAMDVPIILEVSGSSQNNKVMTTNRGAIIGGAVAGVAGATGLLLCLRFRYLRKKRSKRQVIEPLIISSDRTTQAQPAVAQHTNSQAPTDRTPAVPVLHNVLSFLNYPQSINALREKQRGTIDNPVHDSEVTIVIPDSHRDPESARAVDESPDLRREVEDLRRELQLMRQVREAAQEAPPLYDA